MGLDHHDSRGLECYIGPMGLGQDSIGLEYERDVHTYVDFIGLKLRRMVCTTINNLRGLIAQ